jgi:hypothetical protein
MMTYCACAACHHPAGKDRRSFEQWSSPYGGTGALLVIERWSEESLQNNCGALLERWSTRTTPEPAASVTIAVNDCSQCFWTLRGSGDARLLCAGKAQPMVHLRLRLRMRTRFNLWLFARCVALWRSGSRMVSGGAAPLVAGASQIIISWPIESRDRVECSY